MGVWAAIMTVAATRTRIKNQDEFDRHDALPLSRMQPPHSSLYHDVPELVHRFDLPHCVSVQQNMLLYEQQISLEGKTCPTFVRFGCNLCQLVPAFRPSILNFLTRSFKDLVTPG